MMVDVLLCETLSLPSVVNRRVWQGLIALSAILGGCGDDGPTEPEPLNVGDIAGAWDFTEVLIVSAQVLVCRDTGSMRFGGGNGGITATGERVGTCQGLVGSYRLSGRPEIKAVELRDSTIRFTMEEACGCTGRGCADAKYVGTVSRGPPLSMRGSSACSINYDGTWEARLAAPVATLTLQPDSAEILVEETIYLAAVMRDEAGARVFERPVAWSSSDTSLLAVAADGRIVGLAPGRAAVAATLGGMTAEARVNVGTVSFASVRSGAYHSCGVTVHGAVYCWGANDAGQSGPAASLLPCPGVACRRAPGLVPTPFVVSELTLGFLHACGLDADGRAHCWGANSYGQLGRDLSVAASPLPLEVSGSRQFSMLSAGANHVCGVAADGVYCWGLNSRFQLGSSGGSIEFQPTAVGGTVQFQSVTSGEFHTCALSAEGQPYCWGFNWYGQLGVDSVPGSSLPQPVSGDLRLVTLSAGAHHNCGLTGAGEAYCWGRASEGQLGAGSGDFSSEPLAVSGGLLFESLSSGGFHTCAVTAEGWAYCWGAGSLGRLGNGTEEDKMAPVAVSGAALRFRHLSSGFEHSCGITYDGVVYCWGSNYNGQVGVASLPPELTPKRVVGQR